MTEETIPPISVKPLLCKSAHLLDEIAALPVNASPDKYEKRAKAIGEMYKTATIIETYAATYQSSATDNLDYDNTYAATPEQERALREDLLGYYDRIHGRSGTDDRNAGLSTEEQAPVDVLPDVAPDGTGGSATAAG